MGEHNISNENDEQQSQAFMKSLLSDLKALEQMIEAGSIESDRRRIGAEQEMFLIDRALRPAPIAMELLHRANDSRLTTEMGKFNLEANLSPQNFTGRCLQAMESEVNEVVNIARQAALACQADVLLTGILPTLHQTDLTLDNQTPIPRYAELNRVVRRMRGETFNVYLKGLDELRLTHDNLMLEACCTSFQVHLQVSAPDFARLYNLAQVMTAPILAVAANSPILLGQRLWHETRIALFQHSVDERSSTRQLRGHPPRVSFGNAWVKDSVLEIFREEIARFRVILTKHIEEDSLAVLARGGLPELSALRLHNGTVWRWNRPCYGISDGRAHLRIEMRSLPSGPSIPDEMANAAFFLGLMSAGIDEFGDISHRMPFDDARENFLAAARQGLKAQFTWLDGQSLTASSLILDHLLPLAHQGLRLAGIEVEDADHYLGIIEERVRRNQTGSQWSLKSLAAMEGHGTRKQHLRALTASMLEQQQQGQPVHTWHQAALSETTDEGQSWQTVGQFMSTDLFTVRPDDLVDLAANVMDWKHIRHVPVEDDQGRLVGLISHRDLLHLMAQGLNRTSGPLAVKEIMKTDPITVSPDTPTLEAIRLMRQRQIGCLPVTDQDRLVGVVTAQDFLNLASDLIEAHLNQNRSN